jgi:AraC-like DNA-binding protein
MRALRRRLLALHPDRRFLDRLGRALRGHFELGMVGSWESLQATYRSAPPGTVLLVDPYLDSPRGISPSLGALLRQHPSAIVVAVLSLRQGRFRDPWALSQQGVAEILIMEEEGTDDAIRARLQGLRVRPVRDLLADLPALLPGRAQAVLHAAVDTVAAGGGVPDLARALSLTPRSLYNWSVRSELPSPLELLRWVRVLFAATLLDDPGQTVANASKACGYADGRGLQRLIRDLLGYTPTELRERGAFRIAREAFRVHLASGRRRRTHRLVETT